MRKNCFAVSSDGKTLVVVDSQGFGVSETMGGRIRLIEIGSWRLLREIKPTNSENVVQELRIVCFSPEGDKLYGIGFQRIENKDTILKSFLGEFDQNQNGGAWTEISYETLPLHPVGKQLLTAPEGGHDFLTKFYERMSVVSM